MRIKSKFRDYYDSVGGFEATEPLYVRDNTHLYLEKQIDGISLLNITGVLGFCGKLYPFYSYQHNLNTKIYTYDYDAIIELTCDSVNERSNSYYRRSMKQNMEHLTVNNDKYWNILYDRYKSPVVVYQGYNPYHMGYNKRYEVILNPILREFQFYRVKDSYQTFQELSMFLANQASPEKPIPKVSNEDMIVAKGFDLKYSFRKEKK